MCSGFGDDEVMHAPGWYPDPSGTGLSRWWDGSRWSELTSPGVPTPVNHSRHRLRLRLRRLLIPACRHRPAAVFTILLEATEP